MSRKSVEHIEKLEQWDCGAVHICVYRDAIDQTAQVGILASLSVPSESLCRCIEGFYRPVIFFRGIKFGHRAMSSWLVAFFVEEGTLFGDYQRLMGSKNSPSGNKRWRRSC